MDVGEELNPECACHVSCLCNEQRLVAWATVKNGIRVCIPHATLRAGRRKAFLGIITPHLFHKQHRNGISATNSQPLLIYLKLLQCLDFMARNVGFKGPSIYDVRKIL